MQDRTWLNGRLALAGLAFIVATYLVLAVEWNRTVPMFEGYDENFHLEYVYYVHDTGRQPVMPTALFEGMQPPGYYFLLSPLINPLHLQRPNLNPQLIGPNDAQLRRFHPIAGNSCHFCEPARTVRILRLLSTAIGAITLGVVFMISISLFPGRWAVALAATAVVGFLPEFVSIQSLVNNDSLANLLGALLLLGCVRLVVAADRRGRLLGAALAGLSLGLGLVVKDYFLSLLPLSLLAPLLAPSPLRERVLDAAVLATALVASAGHHLVYNIRQYGQVFPLDAERASVVLSYPPEIVHQTVLGLLTNSFDMGLLRHSFWYEGGWGQVLAPDWMYTALDMLTVVVFVGLVVALVKPGRVGLDLAQRRVILMFMATVTLEFAGIIFLNLHLSQFRGRYFQPGLGGIALLILVGVAAVLPRRLQLVAYLAAPALVLAASLFILLGLLPAVYGSSGA